VLITWVIEEQEFYIHFRASRGFFYDPTFTGQIPLVFWDTNNPTLAAQLQSNPVLCIAYSSQCVRGRVCGLTTKTDIHGSLGACAQNQSSAAPRRHFLGHHSWRKQDLRLLGGPQAAHFTKCSARPSRRHAEQVAGSQNGDIGAYYGGSIDGNTGCTAPAGKTGYGGRWSGVRTAGQVKGGIDDYELSIYVRRDWTTFAPTGRPTAAPTDVDTGACEGSRVMLLSVTRMAAQRPFRGSCSTTTAPSPT
jgi:hypothetical protein